MRYPTIVFVAALAASPLPAWAQPAATAAAPGPHVFVTLRATQEEIQGSLLTLSNDSVSLVTGQGAWTYPLTEVSTVTKRGDRSFDGALRGAAVLGGLCVVTCGQGVRNSAEHTRVVLTNAAVGALFGWWFDRAHVGRTTLYPPDSRDRPYGR